MDLLVLTLLPTLHRSTKQDFSHYTSSNSLHLTPYTMASEGWGNSGGAGGEGARLAFCSARARQSLSGASLYSRSFLLLSSVLSSASAAAAARSSSSSLPVPLSLRPYSSSRAVLGYGEDARERRSRGRSWGSRGRSAGNWNNNNVTSWGGGDGGFQSGGYGGGQRSTACFNCGQGELNLNGLLF